MRSSRPALSRTWARLVAAAGAAALAIVSGDAAPRPNWTAPPGKDFPLTGGNYWHQRYSTLDRINTSNVKQLGGAWMIHLEEGRRGLRVGDLRHPDFLRQKLDYLVREKTASLGIPEQATKLRASIDETLARFREVALPHVADTSLFIHRALEAGKDVLFEGAQGSLLDIDHGTYPYVTSSNTMSGAAALGSGVGPRYIDSVLGVAKAYTTRVGGGPFPTELTDDVGERLRKVGHEYGATTGRARRCGWLDVVILRRAVLASGIDAICLTKLDVLDGLESLRIAVSYRWRGERLSMPPPTAEGLAGCEPEYETLPGWRDSTAGATRIDDLPVEARRYLERLETLLGVPIVMVSTSAERGDTIVLRDIFS